MKQIYRTSIILHLVKNHVSLTPFAFKRLYLYLPVSVIMAGVLVFAAGCVGKKQITIKKRPVVVPARIILVKTKDEAEKIHLQLTKGANFAKLAQQYSIHSSAKKYGHMGLVIIWELDSPHREILGRLNPSQFSRAFKTPQGFAILYYIDNQYFDRGIRQFESQQYQEAVEALEIDVSLNPDHCRAYNYLGLGYEKLGQPAKAIQVFKALTALDPKYPGAYKNLGQAYLENKQYEEAIEAYSEALVQTPDDPDIMNNLARALAEKRRSLDIALQLIERALILQPDQPRYWDTLAEIHLARGEKIEALKRINRAIELGGRPLYFKERQRKIAASMIQKKTHRPIPAVAKPRAARPEATQPASPPPSIKKKERQYAVQVIAVRRLSTAEKFRDLFSQRGYRAYINSRPIPDQGLFHRVRLGPYRSFAEAKKTAQGIKKKYQQDYIIFEEKR